MFNSFTPVTDDVDPLHCTFNCTTNTLHTHHSTQSFSHYCNVFIFIRPLDHPLYLRRGASLTVLNWKVREREREMVEVCLRETKELNKDTKEGSCRRGETSWGEDSVDFSQVFTAWKANLQWFHMKSKHEKCLVDQVHQQLLSSALLQGQHRALNLFSLLSPSSQLNLACTPLFASSSSTGTFVHSTYSSKVHRLILMIPIIYLCIHIETLVLLLYDFSHFTPFIQLHSSILLAFLSIDSIIAHHFNAPLSLFALHQSSLLYILHSHLRDQHFSLSLSLSAMIFSSPAEAEP